MQPIAAQVVQDLVGLLLGAGSSRWHFWRIAPKINCSVTISEFYPES
jgi:hypothetical protein